MLEAMIRRHDLQAKALEGGAPPSRGGSVKATTREGREEAVPQHIDEMSPRHLAMLGIDVVME